MNKDVQDWMNFAETDWKVAKHLYDSFYPKPLEIICYHCQQAAEKTIKSLIVNKGTQGGLPRSHDISFLLNQISNMYEIPEKLYDYGDTLSQYGVASRYPHELFLEERNATKALQYSYEIIEWAKKEMYE